MTTDETLHTGSCHCGAVRFEVTMKLDGLTCFRAHDATCLTRCDQSACAQ